MTQQAHTAIVLPKSAQNVEGKSRFDPKLLLKLVRGLEEEAHSVRASKLEDADDNAMAGARLRDLTKLGDTVDAYYEELARSHLDALNVLRALIKPFRDVVALGVGAYSAILADYAVEQATEQAAAKEAARVAASTRDSATLTDALNVVQETKPQKLEGVAQTLEWQIEEVTEPGAVPRVWCCPDVKAIAAHVKTLPPDPLKPPEIEGVKFKLGVRKRVSR